MSSVLSSVICSNRFQLPVGFPFHSRVEILEDGQYLVLRLQRSGPWLPTVVIDECDEVLRSGMRFYVPLAYIGMHKFQHCLALKEVRFLLTCQAIGALLKLHVLDLRNEVIISKPLHPLVPQLTGIPDCNFHFLLAYSGMQQVQRVDLPGSDHDQAPFAELHDFVLDASGVARIIYPTG